jgi:hypothetical protein
MRKREPELLGFHGLVLRSADPPALAQQWMNLTGMPVLRRTAREIILGRGPELFVAIRRSRAGVGDGIVEVHLAVKRLVGAGRRGERDPLGGDSFSRSAGELRLTMREFRRPPAPRWRKTRKPG